MYIVSAYNKLNITRLQVALETLSECYEWVQEIKKQYPLVTSFKIFDGLAMYHQHIWSHHIIVETSFE